MNRKLVFVLLLSAAAVMVGLPQALAAQSVNVSIAGFAYNPAEITISKGTTVIWTQNDAANHTVTSDTGLFDSGNLTTGQTFSLTFNEIGTFKYHCTIHPFMKGTVNVIEMQQRFNISGYKINSTDNNGSGIPDWKIMLLDSTTGMEIANTTTDDTGSYMFMDLANGTYTVTEEMKTGWMNTSQMEQMVTVDGMDVMNVNFSNALMPPQPMFNISGYKINSTNNNGSGIPDWKIMLQNTTTGMEIMNTTTNDTGFYR
ncbi:MAG TPA: cupredoxin domain-containing protein, partial [Candidatus Methanoperedens sp.]|nr:cupredoxin domain-containing protein [Candidatus Methanoperedens sp.]